MANTPRLNDFEGLYDDDVLENIFADLGHDFIRTGSRSNVSTDNRMYSGSINNVTMNHSGGLPTMLDGGSNSGPIHTSISNVFPSQRRSIMGPQFSVSQAPIVSISEPMPVMVVPQTTNPMRMSYGGVASESYVMMPVQQSQPMRVSYNGAPYMMVPIQQPQPTMVMTSNGPAMMVPITNVNPNYGNQ